VKRQMEQGSSVLQAYSPLGWWLRMVLSASSSSGETRIRSSLVALNDLSCAGVERVAQ